MPPKTNYTAEINNLPDEEFKTLANQIQKYIKRLKDHDLVKFIPGMQIRFNIHKSNNVIYHTNIKNDKNHIIILGCRKTFHKLQHLFMTKTLEVYVLVVVV